MSILASESALKDYLLANDDRYRELATEHKRYEAPSERTFFPPIRTKKNSLKKRS